jgi:putative ABC transport system substrate-binding protein
MTTSRWQNSAGSKILGPKSMNRSFFVFNCLLSRCVSAVRLAKGTRMNVVCGTWSVVSWPVFGLALCAMLFARFSPVSAQQPKIARIGYAGAGAPSVRVEALRQGLRELGWVEGKNIVIEQRYLEGRLERSAKVAAEMVRLKLDVIVWSAGNQGAREIKTIPVVYVATTDLVASGLVKSLARPGGNITGINPLASELGGKRLELLKEAMPKLSRVAFLFNPDTASNKVELEELRRAAPALHLTLQTVEARRAADIEPAFSTMLRERVEAFSTASRPANNTNRARIVELASKRTLPAIYHDSQFVEAGGVMSYGPNIAGMFQRAPTYVDKTLKGAKPADLPVEQPTKFEFVINLKAAKQIGLTIPPNVLARADRVIR